MMKRYPNPGACLRFPNCAPNCAACDIELFNEFDKLKITYEKVEETYLAACEHQKGKPFNGGRTIAQTAMVLNTNERVVVNVLRDLGYGFDGTQYEYH